MNYSTRVFSSNKHTFVISIESIKMFTIFMIIYFELFGARMKGKINVTAQLNDKKMLLLLLLLYRFVCFSHI